MKRMLGSFLLFFIGFQFIYAQNQQKINSAEIYKKIEKLNFLGSVLYVGAHPDDENTAMISYLSNKTNARTAYLSMNRGDGGQNIIGSEIRELLGVIRTQELLAARRIDGGQQFFTRANDFGFSKNPTETFEYWNKEEVLSDVVRTFRKFRPDVIINRFNHRTEGDTHGHHTASAILSVEAFDLAGKENKFSDQLNKYEPWQPKRLYFNDSWFFYGSKEKYLEADHDGFMEMELGEYLPLLGKSNSEIAALSRSEHKSQGFGSLTERGSDKSFIEPITGDLKNAEEDIFAGIDTSWKRVKGGKKIGKILQKVQKNYDFENPENSLPQLLKAHRLIQNLEDDFWRTVKSEEIEEIITASAGLYLEAFTDEEYGTLGEEIKLNFEAINRSEADIQLKNIKVYTTDSQPFRIKKKLKNNEKLELSKNIIIPENSNYSGPYWLREKHSEGMYTVENEDLIGLPETPPQLVAEFELTINDQKFTVKRELIYRTSDQIIGEIKEPFAIVPDISVKMNNKVMVFPNDSTRKINVEVQSFADKVSGELRLNQPKGWTVKPEKQSLNFQKKGKKQTVEFTVTPPENQSETKFQPEFITDKSIFTDELHIIDYDHIPTQTVLLPAETKANRLAIKIGNKNIAYIKGAGDEIPSGLREIGYRVTELSGADLSAGKLAEFDAVILGIRAYNMNKKMVNNQDVLFDYVKNGGTLVTQYSQSRSLLTEETAPYKMKMSPKRVTNQKSEVNFLAENHAVLNFPNKISQTDFKGWVQERGLYFPEEFSDKFTPIIGMHDKGEEELQGSLLVANYGKGHYVYTGLSFFRQLPAGVPGAFRLYANILALSEKE